MPYARSGSSVQPSKSRTCALRGDHELPSGSLTSACWFLAHGDGYVSGADSQHALLNVVLGNAFALGR